MNLPNDRLYYLFTGWLENSLSDREHDEFFQLALRPENRDILESWIENELVSPLKEMELPPRVTDAVLEAIKAERVAQAAEKEAQDTALAPVVAVSSRSGFRWQWAAAIFLLLSTGVSLWIGYKSKRPTEIVRVAAPVRHDIPPGKQGAILTLANGKQVVLDSLGNGVVTTQNGTQVVLKNGKLAYNTTGNVNGTTAYNTMSTPKGRQFEVRLPDGTHVWLNSASSITYPTVFNGKVRSVEIKGEVYFEVAKNPAVPFRVKINDRAEVEVLGTHFNINAYADEAVIKTTLLEGAVKVSDGDYKSFLKPRQQAVLQSHERIKIIKNIDVEKVMAWKNGLFDFEGMGIEEVMRQLSRWYDIDVVYEKGVPDVHFVGTLDKNVSLSSLLKAFKGFGIHFRIEEGRKLIVLP